MSCRRTRVKTKEIPTIEARKVELAVLRSMRRAERYLMEQSLLQFHRQNQWTKTNGKAIPSGSALASMKAADPNTRYGDCDRAHLTRGALRT